MSVQNLVKLVILLYPTTDESLAGCSKQHGRNCRLDYLYWREQLKQPSLLQGSILYMQRNLQFWSPGILPVIGDDTLLNLLAVAAMNVGQYHLSTSQPTRWLFKCVINHYGDPVVWSDQQDQVISDSVINLMGP